MAKKPKRDQFIGVRFTKEEKEIIKKYVKKEGTSFTEFIRSALLSHLNNLDEAKNRINYGKINDNLYRLQARLQILYKNIRGLEWEIDEFGHTKLNKDTYFVI